MQRKMDMRFGTWNVKSLRWAGHVARMEVGRSAFKMLAGKPTGKRPFREAKAQMEGQYQNEL